MSLRVLIADDEPLARERLRSLLQELDIEVIDACKNGREALKSVRENPPDVIFLDIRMPDLDGFAFIEALPAQDRPAVIIVSGHEKYAARAFEVYAADFLLKPFGKDRLRTSLRRARQRLQTTRTPDIHAVLNTMRERFTLPEPVDRIPIKSNGRILLLKFDEIDWIGAADNYAEFHVGSSTHLLLSTLTALEARLPAAKFVRISRFSIINVGCVKELRTDPNGRCMVVLQDGTELVITDRRKLDHFLGK